MDPLLGCIRTGYEIGAELAGERVPARRCFRSRGAGNPAGMTSNRVKLLCAGAGVGAVLAMTGVSVVQSTTFSADPALPDPVVPGPVIEEPTEGPTLSAEPPTYTPTTTTIVPAP